MTITIRLHSLENDIKRIVVLNSFGDLNILLKKFPEWKVLTYRIEREYKLRNVGGEL